MQLNYQVGDATRPETNFKPNVIVHCCNNIGGWGSGFVVALNKTFGEEGASSPMARYLKTYEENGLELGDIEIVRTNEPYIYVCNLIGQQFTGGETIAGVFVPPIRYEAIRRGLLKLKSVCISRFEIKGEYPDISSPRFGAALAGGEWNKIEEIIHEVFDDLDIKWTVYDLPKT